MLRNLGLLVFSVILVASAEAEIVSSDQLVHRDGITYDKFSLEPFTGQLLGGYNRVLSISEYVDGKACLLYTSDAADE